VKVERISITSGAVRSFPVTLRVAAATKTVIVQDDYKPTTLTGGNIYDALWQETPLSTLVVTRSSPPLLPLRFLNENEPRAFFFFYTGVVRYDQA
jgi:hypothetical protein